MGAGLPSLSNPPPPPATSTATPPLPPGQNGGIYGPSYIQPAPAGSEQAAKDLAARNGLPWQTVGSTADANKALQAQLINSYNAQVPGQAPQSTAAQAGPAQQSGVQTAAAASQANYQPYTSALTPGTQTATYSAYAPTTAGPAQSSAFNAYNAQTAGPAAQTSFNPYAAQSAGNAAQANFSGYNALSAATPADMQAAQILDARQGQAFLATGGDLGQLYTAQTGFQAQAAQAEAARVAQMQQSAGVDAGNSDAMRARQMELLDYLKGSAMGTNGPSAAEMQFQRNLDKAIAAQHANAAGATGTGRVSANLQSGYNIGELSQDANAQSAMLRAQEQQQARAQLLSGLESTRGQDLTLSGQQTQNNQFNVGQTNQGTLTQAQLQQAANLQNAAAQTSTNQFNVGQTNSVNQFNAAQANTARATQAQLDQAVSIANSQLQTATSQFNAGQINQQQLEQAQLQQQAAMTNLNKNVSMNQFNVGQANSAGLTNMQTQNQVGMFNTGQTNSQNQFNAGQANQVGVANMQTGAQVGMFNTGQTNSMNQFNTGQVNAAGMQNSQLSTQNNQFNAGQANNMTQFNTGQVNAAGMQNNALLNANSQFNAGAVNQNNQFNAGQTNAVGLANMQTGAQQSQFNAGQVNAGNQFNAGQMNQVGMFNAGQGNALAQSNAGLSNQVNIQNAANQISQLQIDNQQKQALMNQYLQSIGISSTAEANAANVQAQKDATNTSFWGHVLDTGGKLLTGASTAGAASDRNSKTDIQPLLSDERQKTAKEKLIDHYAKGSDPNDEVSALLDNLTAYKYKYKDPEMPGAAKGQRYGIMAQDLEKSPMGASIVINDSSGVKKIDTAQAVGVILAAMARMNQKIKAKGR